MCSLFQCRLSPEYGSLNTSLRQGSLLVPRFFKPASSRSSCLCTRLLALHAVANFSARSRYTCTEMQACRLPFAIHMLQLVTHSQSYACMVLTAWLASKDSHNLSAHWCRHRGALDRIAWRQSIAFACT